MKRLWVRLGAVAAVLALGGMALFFGVRASSQESDDNSEPVAAGDPPSDRRANPIPMPQDESAGDPQVAQADLELPAPDATVVRGNDDEEQEAPDSAAASEESAFGSNLQPPTSSDYGPETAGQATAANPGGDRYAPAGRYASSAEPQAETPAQTPPQAEAHYQSEAPNQPAAAYQTQDPYEPQSGSQQQAQYEQQSEFQPQSEYQPDGQYQPGAEYQPQVSGDRYQPQSYEPAPQSADQPPEGQADADSSPGESSPAYNPYAAEGSLEDSSTMSSDDSEPAGTEADASGPAAEQAASESADSLAAEQENEPQEPRNFASPQDSPAADLPQADAMQQAEATQEAEAMPQAEATPSERPGELEAQAAEPLAEQDSQAPADSAPSAAEPRAAAAVPGTGSLAEEIPGERQLEGVQAPSIELEKSAPAEIQVGKPATFEIHLRNTGPVPAHEVVVVDRVPLGTELVGTSPETSSSAEGVLSWPLGTLSPGDDVVLSFEVVPKTEGEIGSVAQVSFQAQASVRSICTKPMLEVEHSGPDKVLIGEDVVFSITISNPGSGATTNIVLEEDVPEGLTHEAGQALEYEVGRLDPLEERQLELVLRADRPGLVKNVLRVHADAGLEAVDETQLEVVAPDLQVAVRGPKRRYLERRVTYEVDVDNPGTAAAKNVDLAAYLPKGLKFVSADHKGKYDEQGHVVFWSLEELPADTTGTVKLTALPIEIGEHQLRAHAEADLGLAADYEHTTRVEGIVELVFTLADLQDPIEVGSETTYEVRVVNQGSKTASNVQLAAVLPPELSPVDADGATPVAIEGQRITMEPLERLGPQGDAVYRIKAKGQQAGDHVIEVQLTSDDAQTPVMKQESTKVYADE